MSVSHHIHMGTSVIVGAAIMALAAAVVLLCYQYLRGNTPSSGLTILLWAAAVVASVVFITLAVQSTVVLCSFPIGYIQQTQVLATSVLYVCAGALC